MATKTDHNPSPDPSPDQDPPRRAMIPRFSQPLPSPEPTTAGLEQLGAENLHSGPRESDDRPAPATRTGSSSVGSKPKHADIAILVVGLLTLVAASAAFAVRLRSGGRLALRRPTEDHLADVAGPVARILMRHADLSKLPADLGDVAAAGAAVADYANDGPLLIPGERYYDALPDDLQEGPE